MNNNQLEAIHNIMAEYKVLYVIPDENSEYVKAHNRTMIAFYTAKNHVKKVVMDALDNVLEVC